LFRPAVLVGRGGEKKKAGGGCCLPKKTKGKAKRKEAQSARRGLTKTVIKPKGTRSERDWCDKRFLKAPTSGQAF